MKISCVTGIAFILVLFISVLADSPSLNLQFHYDIRRDHPTVTQEFLAFDRLGYMFCFIDLYFDHYRKSGGLSDVYFEFMRYFRIYRWKQYEVNITLQYDDGSEPVKLVWLAGINLGNINISSFQLSTEFLLKKEYQLGINWQYTLVWYGEFLNHKLFLNGYFDYWINDISDPDWPTDDPEIAATRYSFQAQPQLGLKINTHWKMGTEVQISRGFLGSVTGKLATEETYHYRKWYLLPTVFIQYNF
jgi:hypothetical protein